MNDREINDLLWRAFNLGSRVMAAQMGQDVQLPAIGELARAVREIAESDATLHDPTGLAVKFKDMAHLFQRLGTLNIRADRELAQRIFQGFMTATGGEE